MAEQKLTLKQRTLTGKKLKSLRKEGLVPAVIYGEQDTEPVLLMAEYNLLDKALRTVGFHSTLELDIDGKKQLAIVKNIDIDPVSRRIINAEFRAVNANAVIEATTPIKIINFEDSEAHKLHLNYLQVLEEVEVKAKPQDLPESINADASKFAAVDDKITIADLVLPEGVELANKELDPATVVANVYDAAAQAAAREAADKAAAEAAAAAEPGDTEETAPAEESKAEAKTEE